MKNKSIKLRILFLASVFLCASVVNVFSQAETPPAPSAPKEVRVPNVQERVLPNGLKVAVVQRTNSPLVTVQLLVRDGASSETDDKAGLANLTADMLTKGTKTRSATQIAEDMEFLGGSIESGAGWNSSFVSVTVTPDKLEKAMGILSDIVLSPAFKQEELDLLKSQTLDELNYNLKQPSFIANYVASKYSFGEHPAGGTPSSIQNISVSDIASFHSRFYTPANSVLICAGDIDLATIAKVAAKYFTNVEPSVKPINVLRERKFEPNVSGRVFNRVLVIDLPNSGQAAVNYYDRLGNIGRRSDQFYPATVANTVLGGGYSARLNYEIRIKRGLSYGAGSNIAWRSGFGNFGTSVQTKNPSAAEVAELTAAELKRLSDTSVAGDELIPRKSTLTGGFGRRLETTNGLAAAVADLYSFGISPNELNSYVSNVNSVTDAQIRDLASKNLLGGDLIIVGDYSVFKDDLAKRFPGMKIDVIKADDLDLSKPNLRK